MRFLGYIFTYSLIWLLHILPERLLYVISDILAWLMYHVARYRRSVVDDNISKAFPTFTKAEVKRTSRKFYHHLSDVILESAVSHFYTEAQALQKISYKNPDLLNEIYKSGKLVMAATGHYGNWEYLSTLGLVSHYPVAAIYKPLKNKYFDRMVKRNRTRFNVMVTPMEQIARTLINYHRENKPVLTINLADQRPMFHQIQYWNKFLGLDAPHYLGTEKLARKLDAAVVFLKIRKIARGRYEVEVEQICTEPSKMAQYEITDAHVKILEDLIREEPAYWLWSHRRWKHSKERYNKEHGITS